MRRAYYASPARTDRALAIANLVLSEVFGEAPKSRLGVTGAVPSLIFWDDTEVVPSSAPRRYALAINPP